MMTVYEAWQMVDGVLFSDSEGICDMRQKNLIDERAIFLHVIYAETPEEANAVHCIKMGFEPYKPIGSPENCPNCQRVYYPKSSSICPSCGDISAV